ncbi:MAG: hypothetical protein ABIF77_00585 [bacterium]
MRILTDCPRRTVRILGDDPDWREVAVGSLVASERELWLALGHGRSVWVGTSSLNDCGDWPRFICVAVAADSQFDVLRQLGASSDGQTESVACLALTGQRFHGHRQRPWVAAAGNLHLSVALFPRQNAARIGLALTMLPAVALIDAVTAASDGALRPGIKWVNDILLGDSKVAGVLTATQAQGGRLELAILGIGCNLAQAPPVPPTPFVPRVSCLHETPGGETCQLGKLNRAVLAALDQRYHSLLRDGPEVLFAAYREASVVVGRRVRIFDEGVELRGGPADWPAPLASGKVLAIEPDLSLRIDSTTAPISRGRLVFEEWCYPVRPAGDSRNR